MTAADPAVLVSREAAVLTLTLSNPGRRNALTWAMYEQFEAACRQAQDDASLRAVVVRGAEGDGFAAGTDIAQFAGFDGEAGLAYEHRVGAVLGTLRDIPVPTIAVVSGAAVGAGLAIAAMCDLVIAERGSVFGAPIARTLGNCLPAPVVQRLVHRMGAAHAAGILLAARLVPAEDLAGAGFVHRLVDEGGLDAALAETLTSIDRSAPLTLRALKQTLRRVEDAVPAADNDDLLLACYGSADFAEGVAAFTGRRHPQWKGA
ncbi:enoyl-CoA hydratase [Microbacterium paludicola]|uniref:Enoyl-CoA hydratase n=1 Tax=Microbacterium paludicola TaxID=300019 RepID=A0A4Y9FUJ1_9MICO|nr:enoyl-CoA hydratase [Microbacterium paludicola]MBF0817076.1 enoyl-CoA hydratase/isomerase family protein [Microbacterium paludicola]TFU32208.1 enoyl-CoA hydratase [Microbacterium paludicola]